MLSRTMTSAFHPRPVPRGLFASSLIRKTTRSCRQYSVSAALTASEALPPPTIQSHNRHAHAVISTFDLFSVGIGPSSSHTVGPWRAGGIFVGELEKARLLDQVASIKVTLYGSLAATGKGHGTVEAILMGLQGYDCEIVDTSIVQPNYRSIMDTKRLSLAGKYNVNFDVQTDIRWKWDAVLPEHPNGMNFCVFNADGDLLALNDYFSVGGGFVVTPKSLQQGENIFYKQTNRDQADPARRRQDHSISDDHQLVLTAKDVSNIVDPLQEPDIEPVKWALPPMPFASGNDLLELCQKNNLTVAQVVWENERHYLSDDEIRSKTMNLWNTMDTCIREGVSHTDSHLPGSLRLRRRAPGLYKRLMRGFYPSVSNSEDVSLDDVEPPKSVVASQISKSNGSRGSREVIGQLDHPVPPIPRRKTVFPAMDFLSAYAIAVNEVNAAGGRVVTAPTNGAAGIIPSVAKYIQEFISIKPERDILTFLLTASAVGMLFKRGATISAAEGGCMAEVGVACAMAAAGFVACMGGSPSQVLQAAEIGIEHNLGLTCDPIDGLVQAPCIERNAIGAVKAVTAAQLALSDSGGHLISLDQAIHAMRETAMAMHTNYKETSLGGLATTVKISVKVPNC